MSKEIKELRRIRSLLSLVTGFEDDDQEHIEDARESIGRVIDSLAEQPAQQESVAHPVIAGALFDFMGWLTSRDQKLTLSSTDEASPAVEAITEFAKMRGLSLDDARVQDWQDNTAPPAGQRQWVGLTDDEIARVVSLAGLEPDWVEAHIAIQIVRVLEAKLKEKNT